MPDFVDKTLTSADRRITVSVFNPDDWFAPGVAFGPGARTHSEGNHVTALVDGKRAMAEMDLAILGSTFVYLTGWEFQEEVLLQRPAQPHTRLLDALGLAVEAGAQVHVLMWAGSTSSQSPSSRPDPGDPAAFLTTGANNALAATNLRAVGAQVVLDDRSQTAFGFNVTSHHQKTAIVGGDQGAVGFCGGIDIALGRWDRPEHVADDPQRDRLPAPQPDPSTPGAFLSSVPPWHDVHAMVRGPAVRDLERNFIERWNDLGQGAGLLPGLLIPATEGTHVVQVVRTIGAGNYNDFAPGGEFGILATYLAAVGQAQRYIYMENQYFVSEVLADALIAALQRNADAGRDFRIILVLPHTLMEVGTTGGEAITFHQRGLIRRLRAADPGGMFAVYFLHQPVGARDIFIHAKVAIVDDVWATIGSANLNRRGFCFDAEINLAVIDTEVADKGRRFARDLRLELWQEHLGLDASTIGDPVAGAAIWAAQAGAPDSRVRVFDEDENPGEDSVGWNSFIDPACDDDVAEQNN